MTINEINIRRIHPKDIGNPRALYSIVVESCLAIHDIKVIQLPERQFAAMPSRWEPYGIFRDIVHPMDQNTRSYIESAVLAAYQKMVETCHPIWEPEIRNGELTLLAKQPGEWRNENDNV